MLNAIEAHVVQNGLIRLDQPLPAWVDDSTQVFVVFTKSQNVIRKDESISGALLSDTALMTDWLRPEEDAAWANLQ
jgi:hypothetical protein